MRCLVNRRRRRSGRYRSCSLPLSLSPTHLPSPTGARRPGVPAPPVRPEGVEAEGEADASAAPRSRETTRDVKQFQSLDVLALLDRKRFEDFRWVPGAPGPVSPSCALRFAHGSPSRAVVGAAVKPEVFSVAAAAGGAPPGRGRVGWREGPGRLSGEGRRGGNRGARGPAPAETPV